MLRQVPRASGTMWNVMRWVRIVEYSTSSSFALHNVGYSAIGVYAMASLSGFARNPTPLQGHVTFAVWLSIVIILSMDCVHRLLALIRAYLLTVVGGVLISSIE